MTSLFKRDFLGFINIRYILYMSMYIFNIHTTTLRMKKTGRWLNAWKQCVLIMLPDITGENDAEKQISKTNFSSQKFIAFCRVRPKPPSMSFKHGNPQFDSIQSNFTPDHSPKMNFHFTQASHSYATLISISPLFNCNFHFFFQGSTLSFNNATVSK